MDEIKTKGIVIKSTDFKDSDKIVTIFSAELGVIKARARGVKKDKAKLAFAVQPFAFVEFVLNAKGGFYTIINATSIDQFFNVTLDFDNFIFMMACLEVCEKTAKENDFNQDLFLLLLNSLKLVCYGGVSANLVFLKFMFEAFKILGYLLELDVCACCSGNLSQKVHAYSYDYNGLLCAKCCNVNDFLELSDGEFAIFKNVNQTDFDKLANLKFLSRNDIVSVVSLVCKIFRIMTDEEISTIKQYL